MTTRTAPAAGPRPPLTRSRILDEALRYVDEHGLAALSMHKLGAELGVKGMSLYNHVTDKNDVLDGIVETLWAQIETAAPAEADWRPGMRTLARAIRDVLHRHPNAAPLISSQKIMPAPALRVVRDHIAAVIDSGVAEDRAYELMRTLTTYALGSALADVAWGLRTCGCRPTPVAELLRPGTPDDLAAVADVFCGQSDSRAQFELGLGLMLRGIDCAGD